MGNVTEGIEEGRWIMVWWAGWREGRGRTVRCGFACLGAWVCLVWRDHDVFVYVSAGGFVCDGCASGDMIRILLFNVALLRILVCVSHLRY